MPRKLRLWHQSNLAKQSTDAPLPLRPIAASLDRKLDAVFLEFERQQAGRVESDITTGKLRSSPTQRAHERGRHNVRINDDAHVGPRGSDGRRLS